MVKEKIGQSKVRNGVAADWFILQKNLPRGCYQLIAEYLGNSMYKPSYDIKKLIVGYYTEFRNLREYYVVNLNTRKLIVSGRLVGTDDEGGITYLANRKIKFNVRAVAPPNMHPFEQLVDAKDLYTENGDEYAYTDANGNFSIELYFPTTFQNWKYTLLITFPGDYDYIMCSEARPLYMGAIPTLTVASVEPSNHIRNDGTCILKAKVYSYEDIDIDGQLIGNPQSLTCGNIKWFTSTNNLTWKPINAPPESLARDGVVEHRLQFDYDAGETHEIYIRATFTGCDGDIGYLTSNSNSIHLTIDEYGDSANPITMKLQDLVVDQKTIYYVVDEISDKSLRFYYGTNTNDPVPLGECVVTAKRVSE